MGSINIRDPLYGFISLDEIESEILDTYPFQRLRFIHQLGTTPFVYPAGCHTRFEHSLGVLKLSARLIKCLKEQELPIEKIDEKVFRLSAMLHDIGHPPFSHVSEDMMLLAPGLDHEEMTIRIIEESEIGEIIREKLNKEAIARIKFISTGRGKPVSELDSIFTTLLTGEAGIDRMDYLLRDSYYLGVAYGKFDLERLFETILYNSQVNPPIIWEEGGQHALEQFILARYFMFIEVYFHKTRRILDYHLYQIIKECLKETIKSEFYPKNVNEYIKWNDMGVFDWMLKNQNNKYVKRIIKRKFFRKLEKESKEHPNSEEIILWDQLEPELRGKFSANDYYLDKAEKSPFKFEKSDISILVKDKPIQLPRKSTLVASLKAIKKRRIYVEEGKKRKEIEKFVENFFKQKRGG
ncbi:MAG: hypothetical protein B6D56_02030 [Candidatus Omnitrophica bacterium 4484_70.1]|nr:MAG: hypothetical protein B6D56_02030 [Candidatus Omnitrophica bacterium 4484_70.1]